MIIIIYYYHMTYTYVTIDSIIYSRFQLTFHCYIPNFLTKCLFQNSPAGLQTKAVIGPSGVVKGDRPPPIVFKTIRKV